uniref:Uncharacterized protein n=1 Tax=Ciona savignyi TaxID=51511 RepID=H2ZFJ2_CIOSA
MEEEARRKMADLEEQFKTQLNELQLRLDQARHEINRQNESDGKQLRVEVEVLRRLKQTSREEISSLGVENTRLKNRSRQVEARLQASEDKQVRMQHDFDIAYRGMALCNKSFDEQRHHMEVLLEQFKENSKKLQDENDELMTHLDAINRRWKPDEATSSRRYSTDYVSSSMTSSTTCTFDSGMPKPSLNVDDCDVSIDFTNSGFSGELPELSPIGKAPPNNFLNETKRPP